MIRRNFRFSKFAFFAVGVHKCVFYSLVKNILNQREIINEDNIFGRING